MGIESGVDEWFHWPLQQDGCFAMVEYQWELVVRRQNLDMSWFGGVRGCVRYMSSWRPCAVWYDHHACSWGRYMEKEGGLLVACSWRLLDGYQTPIWNRAIRSDHVTLPKYSLMMFYTVIWTSHWAWCIIPPTAANESTVLCHEFPNPEIFSQHMSSPLLHLIHSNYNPRHQLLQSPLLSLEFGWRYQVWSHARHWLQFIDCATLLMVALNFGGLDGVGESGVRPRRSLKQTRAS